MKHLRPTDIRGAAQLATQATVGVSRIAEGVHQSVWGSMGVPGGKAPGETRGITGLVYQCVRGVTQLVGKSVDVLLAKLQPVLELAEQSAPESYQRAAVLAALNGVLGDRLVAMNNPLATPMTLRWSGRVLSPQNQPTATEVNGKVMLLVHGLCMNELSWDLPLQDLGYTPVYLRYNTGLHTSTNGKTLAEQLEQLRALWPVPIEELTIVAHSMGGLITRSAVHQARMHHMQWPQQLKNIVFLGTPHHGAPLERAGNWVDVILGTTPYSRPFATLGQLRSAGITDLRFGHVLEADWAGRDRFEKGPYRRQPLPLPAGVACFTVAATTAARRGALAERLVGDGLVPLRSALGQHNAPEHRLNFAKPNQHILYRTHHMALLASPDVRQQILLWLGQQYDHKK
ncbi:MAG: alpha/beta hydrolase [Rhodoferax sp.]|nr:alpha/beta hydrolase [Rhodoferax sp.]